MAGNGLFQGSHDDARGPGRAPARPPQGRPRVDRYGFDDVQESEARVDWANVPSELIHDAITAVTRCGDGITFSRTSDGGAYSVTILSGGKSAKKWPSTDALVAELLQQVIERAS